MDGHIHHTTQDDDVWMSDTTIDDIMARLWIADEHLLKLLACHQTQADVEQTVTYAKHICDVLEAQLHYYGHPLQTKADCEDLELEAGQDYDLVVFGRVVNATFSPLFSKPLCDQIVEKMPTSVLVMGQPYWPIERILLIVRGQEHDELAVNWLVRFAKLSKVAVTVLAVLPKAPAMYSQILRSYGSSSWQASNTPWGDLLRRIGGELFGWDIKGRFQFRSGSVDQQINAEISESDPDLVILAADPKSWLERRVLGEVLPLLLADTNRPVLVAKPQTATAKQAEKNTGQATDSRKAPKLISEFGIRLADF